MALFVLTSDSVLTLEQVKTMLDMTDENRAILAANSVTDKFKRFMNRVTFTRTGTSPNFNTVSEWRRGTGIDRIWLRGGPVTLGDSNDLTIGIHNGTTLDTTYTYSDDEISVRGSTLDEAGTLTGDGDGLTELQIDGAFPDSVSNNLLVTYTPGWVAIPGDIVQAAIEQIAIDRRRQRDPGATNVSREGGGSVGFEREGLSASVRDTLNRYRVMS